MSTTNNESNPKAKCLFIESIEDLAYSNATVCTACLDEPLRKAFKRLLKIAKL